MSSEPKQNLNTDRELSTLFIKENAIHLGPDLCGIASVDRFDDAPCGYGPCDILPECNAVVVLALNSLKGTMSSKSMIPYTMMRNQCYDRLNTISLQLASILEEKGALAVPIPRESHAMWTIRNGKSKGSFL